MPSTGRNELWPFSEMAERGLSQEAERLSRELMSSTFASEDTPLIRPLSASSLQQGTSSTTSNQTFSLEMIRRATRQLDEMAVRHDELMRPVLSEAYRQHLITGLSPNMMVFDEWYRDDSTDAIRYNIDYEQAVRAPTQLTPKEPKMNEMMQALEAMIRRVVTEELSAKQLTVPDYTADAFARSLKNYVDTCGPEWTAVVSQGALDQPWFDNAVKAEVANTVEEGAFTFATKDAFDQYVKAMVEPITGGTAQNGGYSFRDEDSFVYAVTQIVQDDHLSGTFERAVRDIVLADSAVHDHIVEIVEATGSDNIRSRVESVIEDYDFSSIVAGVVGDMSFSVSVD